MTEEEAALEGLLQTGLLPPEVLSRSSAASMTAKLSTTAEEGGGGDGEERGTAEAAVEATIWLQGAAAGGLGEEAFMAIGLGIRV